MHKSGASKCDADSVGSFDTYQSLDIFFLSRPSFHAAFRVLMPHQNLFHIMAWNICLRYREYFQEYFINKERWCSITLLIVFPLGIVLVAKQGRAYISSPIMNACVGQYDDGMAYTSRLASQGVAVILAHLNSMTCVDIVALRASCPCKFPMLRL